MQLFPWSHANSAGFTSRGWHSQPSGKPVLHFLHGNGYCGRVYEPMLELLSADFDLWLCDAQGHGESDHGGRFHGWNRNAELAVEAWNNVGRVRFTDAPLYALGHSFGGVLSSLIMAQHPQLFKRAVLLDPVLFPAPMLGVMAVFGLARLSRRTGMAAKAVKRRKVWPDRATAHSLLEGRGMFRGWTAQAFNAYINHALKDTDDGVELKCQPSREADVFSSHPRRLWSSLAKITTPTEVIYGQSSYPFVIASVTRWCTMNGHVHGQVVEGGHCFMQEHPEASAQKVGQFLLST